MTTMNDFLAVEDILRRRREQQESVRHKDTPFRVEFRFGGGHKAWSYFVNLEDAEKAEDRTVSYCPKGRAVITRPLSKQIQKRGPRGGWSNL